MTRFYIPVYALTLILSAFLLFSVQPLFSKMMLPLLGGSASVWNTSMLFFQAVLLMGYAYAHGTSRLFSVKIQSVLHIILLGVCCIFLPLGLASFWPEPNITENLINWQLGLMAVSIGAPFFILSGCAPMFQRWFSFTKHENADNPYFLYSASNLGSVVALLSYPFIVEPLLTLDQQSALWSYGYIALIVMAVLSASVVFRDAQKNPKKAATAKKKKSTPITNKQRLSWVFVAFIPSSLMLGVTAYIARDIASVPLLWIIPLTIYVGTFIIAFSRKKLISQDNLENLQFLGIIGLLVFSEAGFGALSMVYLSVHLILFAITAQLCHSKLADIKPSADDLTEFYLFVSLGGVLGGIFNALIAPKFFIVPIEYMLVLVLSTLVRSEKNPIEDMRNFFVKKGYDLGSVLLWTMTGLIVLILAVDFFSGIFSKMGQQTYTAKTILTAIALLIYMLSTSKRKFLIVTAIVITVFPISKWPRYQEIIFIDRSYFGVSLVKAEQEGDLIKHKYSHGITLHGAQLQNEGLNKIPLTYYYNTINKVFDLLNDGPRASQKQSIAVAGLGVGSVACYGQPNRHFDFYEIDPLVQQIAEDEELFSYLSDCGSPYDIILGDARLQMANAKDNSYDAIFIDIFSSDSIPVHIFTKEAFEVYLSKLKPDGVIAANISNRYLDMLPVLNTIAKDLDLTTLFKITRKGKIEEADTSYKSSYYTVLAPNYETIKPLEDNHGWRKSERFTKRVWTDDYANLLSVIVTPFHKPAQELIDQQKEVEEKE